MLNAEKNHSSSSYGNRQTKNPPSSACLTIRIIYNNGWVQSAGGGNTANARQRALDVLAETQNIYATKYETANRLDTQITFKLVGEGIKFKKNLVGF